MGTVGQTAAALSPVLLSQAQMEGPRDCLGVEHAASPSPAARVLQSGPQPGLLGQRGVRLQVGPQWAGIQNARALGNASAADEVDGTLQVHAVNHDLDRVAFLNLAEGARSEERRVGKEV